MDVEPSEVSPSSLFGARSPAGCCNISSYSPNEMGRTDVFSKRTSERERIKKGGAATPAPTTPSRSRGSTSCSGFGVQDLTRILRVFCTSIRFETAICKRGEGESEQANVISLPKCRGEMGQVCHKTFILGADCLIRVHVLCFHVCLPEKKKA